MRHILASVPFYRQRNLGSVSEAKRFTQVVQLPCLLWEGPATAVSGQGTVGSNHWPGPCCSYKARLFDFQAQDLRMNERKYAKFIEIG